MTIIVILLSFEKFLSNIPPIPPTMPSIIAEIPIFLFIKKSKHIPKKIPIGIPNLFPPNNPKNSTNITNKFGVIPAILNQLKKMQGGSSMETKTIVQFQRKERKVWLKDMGERNNTNFV